MKRMKIFRVEKLEIMPGERQTVHDVKAIINKTQDLTVLESEVMENKNAFLFTVKRELEWYPDSIK